MSYNIPKMLSSKFQTCSIKIEDLNINPLNPFNPISTKGEGVEHLKLLLGMSYNMPKMLSSEIQSPIIKIQDSKLTLLIIVTLSAPRGGGVNFKLITKNVL